MPTGGPTSRSAHRITIGCPDTPRTDALQYGNLAHAHIGGYRDGHICFSGTWENMDWSDEYPSATFLHEYAHLLARNSVDANGKHRPHGKTWREHAERLWKDWGYRFPFQRRWRAQEMPLRGKPYILALVRERKRERDAKEAVDQCQRDGHDWVRWSVAVNGGIVTEVRMRCQRCKRRTRKATKSELIEEQVRHSLRRSA